MEGKLKNILILSYFFRPDKRVGALRTSYWYQELNKFDEFNVEVVTATKDASGNGVHIVPSSIQISRFALIKDLGQKWKTELKEYLSNYDKKIDVIIISGSPFMHFGLTPWLKKKFGCKVLLDYRDPFAINPGFNNSGIKMKIKMFFEKRFNRAADALVTVNNYCGEIIAFFDDKPNAIVQNGYDETVTPMLREVELTEPSFAYTGKFYFNPTHLLGALGKLNLKLDYAGPDSELIKDSNLVEDHGFVSYQEAVNIIGTNDIGVIQTYGEDFQSTTKLFDYIRCHKVILIISNNHLYRGSLHEELKGYPNVFWANNNEKDILEKIKEIQEATYTSPSNEYCESFSREKQMVKLIGLLNKLN